MPYNTDSSQSSRVIPRSYQYIIFILFQSVEFHSFVDESHHYNTFLYATCSPPPFPNVINMNITLVKSH